MNSGSQESQGSSDFLAFDARGNQDGPKNFRNNFQYRPYNRNRNNRNQHFRRDQFMSGRNDGDGQFAPADFSSPVGGHPHKFDDGFRNRPNHFNHHQNRRNFTPFKVSRGENKREIHTPFHANLISVFF